MSSKKVAAAAKAKIAAKPSPVTLSAPAPASVETSAKAAAKSVRKATPVLKVVVPSAPTAPAARERKPAVLKVTASAPVGTEADRVKKPRKYKKLTLLQLEVRRYRTGRLRAVPLVQRAVVDRMVREAVNEIPGLRGFSVEEQEIFGLMGAEATGAKKSKNRIERAVIDDLRDAVEAYTLRELELLACIVRHDKEITATAKHMTTLEAMEDVTY